jgi:flagellin
MPLSISTNVASMAAQRSFMSSNAALETAFERLSSGKRINSAVDDAAGLAIGKDLEARVSGLNQAIRNTNDGISMVQIAESAMDEATTILQRMRDLAVQAANDSLTTTERGYLDDEASKLSTTLNAVLDQATFNGKDLIDTNANVTLTFQVGADNGDTLAVQIDSLSAATLTVEASDITIGTTVALASASIAKIDAALGVLYSDRAGLGAVQAQMESTVRNLSNVAENTAAATGRVIDTDYAAETANLTKAQILQQAATSILAQANAQPQSVLALLQ